MEYAKVLKMGTSEGATLAWQSRRDGAQPAATTSAHADSVPRTVAQEKAHQKALESDNWHTKTMAAFKDTSNDSLRYIRNDARLAATVNPTGRKASQYLDAAHYAGMELRARGQE